MSLFFMFRIWTEVGQSISFVGDDQIYHNIFTAEKLKNYHPTYVNIL
jgi:hypothetical protein